LHSWKPAALEAIVDANTGGETKVESDAASFGKTIVVVAIVVTAIITILAGVTAGLLTAILLVACIVGGVVYCIPTAIATNRGHPNALPILILNIAFGWTFVGWVGALIWACLAFEEKG
jgi:4-hydroxybenzoate polyprenyltransferase